MATDGATAQHLPMTDEERDAIYKQILEDTKDSLPQATYLSRATRVIDIVLIFLAAVGLILVSVLTLVRPWVFSNASPAAIEMHGFITGVFTGAVGAAILYLVIDLTVRNYFRSKIPKG